MTIAENERLAVVEQQIKDIDKKLDHLINKFEAQEGKYITQRFAMWLAGFTVGVVMVGIAFANWLHNR